MPASWALGVADMDAAVRSLQSEFRVLPFKLLLPTIVGIHPAGAGLPQCHAMLSSITCFSILLNFWLHDPYLLFLLIFFGSQRFLKQGQKDMEFLATSLLSERYNTKAI